MDGASLTIGAVVGTGIFLTAGDVARSLPHPVLVLGVWLTGGLLVLAGALAYAEMGAMYPHAGGLYHFLRAAWGPLPAFLYGWTCLMVIMTGGIAAIAVGFGDYLGALVPAFSSERTVWAVGALHVSGAQLAALLAIVALTATNHFGVREGASVQNLFTLVKLGAIVALVACGLLRPATAAVDWSAPLPAAPLALAVPLGVALIATLWTYDGWYALTFSAGEVRDPRRDLPRGLLLGVAVVIVAYAALNLVYLRALGVHELARTSRVAEAATRALFGRGGARDDGRGGGVGVRLPCGHDPLLVAHLPAHGGRRRVLPRRRRDPSALAHAGRRAVAAERVGGGAHAHRQLHPALHLRDVRRRAVPRRRGTGAVPAAREPAARAPALSRLGLAGGAGAVRARHGAAHHQHAAVRAPRVRARARRDRGGAAGLRGVAQGIAVARGAGLAPLVIRDGLGVALLEILRGARARALVHRLLRALREHAFPQQRQR
jgi:hypothetical protein